MKIYVRHGSYYILSISKVRLRWRGNLKRLSHEKGWIKSAENIVASHFKSVLSIDATFSQAHRAGQSLKKLLVVASLKKNGNFRNCLIGQVGFTNVSGAKNLTELGTQRLAVSMTVQGLTAR
jgi:hypothetical protein